MLYKRLDCGSFYHPACIVILNSEETKNKVEVLKRSHCLVFVNGMVLSSEDLVILNQLFYCIHFTVPKLSGWSVSNCQGQRVSEWSDDVSSCMRSLSG